MERRYNMTQSTRRLVLIALVLFSLACIISFLSCQGGKGKNSARNAQTGQADGTAQENGMESSSNNTGSSEKAEQGNQSSEQTEKQALLPPAEPAEGAGNAPAGELSLVISVSGLDDPIELKDGMTVRVDKSLYLQCTIVNSTQENISFTFATSQKLEATFADAQGNVVFRWSQDRRFAQVVSSIELSPNQQWSHEITIPIGEKGLAPGTYSVTVELAGIPPLETSVSSVTIAP